MPHRKIRQAKRPWAKIPDDAGIYLLKPKTFHYAVGIDLLENFSLKIPG